MKCSILSSPYLQRVAIIDPNYAYSNPLWKARVFSYRRLRSRSSNDWIHAYYHPYLKRLQSWGDPSY